MKAKEQQQALENAIKHFELKGVILHRKEQQDKRRTIPKFFLQHGQESISPALNYNDMNHFILGMGKAAKLEQESETRFIIYGSAACRAIRLGGIKELTEGIKDGTYKGEYTMCKYDNPEVLEILMDFEGWDEYAPLNQNEYEQIRKAEEGEVSNA
jgi:hypothetical protein